MTQPPPQTPPGSEPGPPAGEPPQPPPPPPGPGQPGPTPTDAGPPETPDPYAQPGSPAQPDPSAQPGGYAQPGGAYGQPSGGYGQPGAYGQPGEYAQPGGYGQPGGPYPPPGPAAQPRGLSITAFVLGLLGCLPLASIAAIVVGIIALVRRQALRGLAIAGIILGLLWTIGGIAFFASGAASRMVESVDEAAGVDGSTDAGQSGAGTDGDAEVIESSELALGDCFDDPAAFEAPAEEAFVSGELFRVSCDQPHAFEVYHVSDIAGSEYPGDDAVLAEVDQACLEAFEGFVGLPYEESVIDVIYYYPTPTTWSALDDRSIICAVTEGESTTGSLEGVGR